eukprot:UN11595
MDIYFEPLPRKLEPCKLDFHSFHCPLKCDTKASRALRKILEGTSLVERGIGSLFMDET